MRIAVLANLKQNAPVWGGMPADQWDDLDSSGTIESIAAALEESGHEGAFFEANILPPFNLIEKLTAYAPDLCFNIAEGHFGDSRESQTPAVLEVLRIPYTGSRVLTLALALDKPMTKRVLHYHGLPTPEFQVFESEADPIDEDLLDAAGALRFPMFVKPSREGTSVGVSGKSIVRTESELRERVAELGARYPQPILCERFIEGREISVGVVGNLGKTAARRVNDRMAVENLPDTLTFLPPFEMNMASYDVAEAGVYTNRIKVDLVDKQFDYLCPAPLSRRLEQLLYLLTAAVFRVTGCRDVARVDFRLDAANRNTPYILEVNPLPGLSPLHSDLCMEAKAAGWTYTQLIHAIVEAAAVRHNLPKGETSVTGYGKQPQNLAGR